MPYLLHGYKYTRYNTHEQSAFGFTINITGIYCLEQVYLLFMIGIHITGVIVTEIREKNAIVSAMITGNKYFTEDPVGLTDE